MSTDTNKFAVGSRICYSVGGGFDVWGVVVYRNDSIFVARVGEGSMELMTSLEDDGFTYTFEDVVELFPDFKDEGKRFIHEVYIVYNYKRGRFKRNQHYVWFEHSGGCEIIESEDML